ncbi:MAG: cupin domain-containing protein [Methylosarcina sp.]
MTLSCQNIFTNIPDQLKDEFFDTILKRKNLHVERIISRGHSTPPGQWYDQAWDEWILLIQGQATLLYEKNTQIISMTAGDHLLIPARTRHRVEWSHPEMDTIWLAIHLR